MSDPAIKALRGPIMVLGASGFVGANLFHMLRMERDDVFAVARRRPGWRLDGARRDQLREADITDPAAVKNLIDSVKPQTVFDCIAYGGYSFEENVRLIHQTNFTSLVEFMEILAEHPFAAYIHAGSSSEYGLNCSAPDEDAPLRPNGHYSVSKAAMAHYIHFCGTIRGLPVVNLRLYSVYGPLEDTSRLMPNLVRKALQGQYPPFVNPEISRDFIYITDVCAAFIEVAAQMRPEHYGASYNIGTGTPTTIRQLAAVTKAVFGISEDPSFGSMPPRKWDVTEWYANPARAKAAFGWSTKVSLAQGLEMMCPWVSSLANEDFKERSKLAALVPAP